MNPTPINFSLNYDQMLNCEGKPLDDDIIDTVVPIVRKQFHKQCCWVYVINWDGREVNDITCSTAMGIKCEVNIKIIRATVLHYCIKKGLKSPALDLLKKKPDLGSNDNI